VPKIAENALVIYTDGSLKWRGRKGGYGIRFLHFDNVGAEHVLDEYSSPGVHGTTNNRMELQACVTALEMAPSFDCFTQVHKIVIRTDSRYVVNNYKSALFTWSKNGWLKREGGLVDNAEIWRELNKQLKKLAKRVEFEWVKGHADDVHNLAADKLAGKSATSPLSRREHRSIVRRKTTKKKTKRGSIEMRGQVLNVHIVDLTWLRLQKMNKYRCEVVSTDSPYFGSVDFIWSALDMRPGHTYEVLLNDNQENPLILDVLREIEKEPKPDPAPASP
jgi:ribonuclease HI